MWGSVIMTDFTSYVNIKQGTFSEPRFSHGNTLPLIETPFGMNAFSIQTNGSADGWYYHPSHRQTEGIRLTHQPSPWVRDYGHFVMIAQSGEPRIKDYERCTGFEEREMNPAFMELYFIRYGLTMCIAPTERAAAGEVCYYTNQTPRFTVIPFDSLTRVNLDVESGELTGYVNAYGDGTRKDFRMYFYMKFDKPINVSETVITYNNGKLKKGLCAEEIGAGISLAFHIKKGEKLGFKIGTSFISQELAKLNTEREIGSKTYEDIKEETKAKWNELLSKIRIIDSEEKKQTFYSCFYRCFLFPHTFYEYNAEGRPIHYSTKHGLIADGVMYTDNGFWDTFRTLYPLLTLLIPDKFKEIIEGYLNFYKEEGWLPKWISPGERGIMPGTLIDVVLADAAVKGMLTKEQITIALEGMLKNATTPSGTHLNGRIGVEDYIALGYVPADNYKESINNSLDAYYCDYCISEMAGIIGRKDISEEYKKRSQKYKLLFDKDTGFLRGRNQDFSRPKDFSPFKWGGGYCEGGPWQNGFAVQHDIDGLSALYGGKDGFTAKLDELFSTPPVYDVGSYGMEIHEMTEMAAADFGQCAISNQPSFHIPYLYSAVGEREKTAYWVNKIVNEGFNSTEKGFPGDEDNGSMSAWYIFSILGIYPLCPAKAEYIIGVCGAECAEVILGNGNLLTIKNENYLNINAKNMNVTIDGKSHISSFITHSTLLSARNIIFYERR
jgi:predicted alpha-1,2-mannosidase